MRLRVAVMACWMVMLCAGAVANNASADITFNVASEDHGSFYRYTYTIHNVGPDSVHTLIATAMDSALAVTATPGWDTGYERVGSERVVWWRATSETGFLVPGGDGVFSYDLAGFATVPGCIYSIDDGLVPTANGSCDALVSVPAANPLLPMAVQCFPNPSSGRITLAMRGIGIVDAWAVVDVAGRRQAQGRYEGGAIDVSLRPGLYYVVLLSKGVQVSRAPVVIVR